ncbi:MAG: hypothetical protein CMO55_11230 [Verrucomicrobiales bacterium]|nr:hypothetical protein [Verrucomicrobiales bacterium]
MALPYFHFSPRKMSPRIQTNCARFVAIGICLAWSLQSMGDVDSNSNGIDDVWELLYNARDVVASGDEDKDLVKNGDEARAGTDPHDPNDFLEFSTFERSGTTVTVTFQSQKGKVYKIYQTSSTINPSWAQVDTDIVGDGTVMSKEMTGITETEAYFRIGVDDADADGDNLTDWAEEALDGFDPGSNFSFDPNTADDETFTFLFQNSSGPLEVEIAALESEAYEKFGGSGSQAGKIRVRRTGGDLAETTVFFTVGGDAEAGDYSIVDENDQAVAGGFITIGAGQPQRVLSIVPTDDGVAEFPETVDITLDSHPDYGTGASTQGSVQIFDLEDNPGNWQLFYGQLTPERGAITSASGYATLRLNGKRTVALVDLNFSGLSSPQTAAHVHQSTSNGSGGVTNGPVMESLELGIVDDHVWNIGPAGANSAQDLIDALFGQNGKLPLYANAHTTNNGGGEVWAFFTPYSSGDFNPPPDPPAIDDLQDQALKRDISRFLMQATFGPSEETIDALYNSVVNDHAGDRIAAYSAWIDNQYAQTDTKFFDLIYALDSQEYDLNGNDRFGGNPQPFNKHHRISWWTIARGGKDQLRKRVAFALSQILVISEQDATVRNRCYGATSYFDMLSENADDSYREALYDVSRHPLMGRYLSHLQNNKATYDGQGNILISPDENYAREIMQLFSIGLVMLNPDGSLLLDENGEPVPTYTNDDITELARAFTGWSFAKRVGSRGSGYPTQDNTAYYYNGGPKYFEVAWMTPMKNFGSNYHDRGEKTVLGTTFPAGQNGYQDLNSVVDLLFNHQNTGPFIARRLIQRLVTSNPSNGYIYRVAQAFENSNGNVKEMVRAILLDYEARTLSLADDIGYGKQKEPVIRQVQVMRSMDSVSELLVSDLATYGLSAGQIAGFEPGATQHRMYSMTGRLGQSPHDAPSVFNWFLPDYILGGELAENGLFAPGFTITSESQVVETANLMWSAIVTTTGLYGQPIYGGSGGDTTHRMLHDLAAVQAELTAAVAVAPGANNVEKERNAIAAVLDKWDLILCAGALKARYDGDTGANPREAIINACERVWNHTDDTPTSTDLREAARDLLYLICTSPDFLIQR